MSLCPRESLDILTYVLDWQFSRDRGIIGFSLYDLVKDSEMDIILWFTRINIFVKSGCLIG